MPKSGARKGAARPAPAPRDTPVTIKPTDDRSRFIDVRSLKVGKRSFLDKLDLSRGPLSEPPVGYLGKSPRTSGVSVLGQPRLAVGRNLNDEAEDAFKSFADRSGLDLPGRIEILRALLASHEARLPRPKVVPLPTTAPETWSKRDLNLRENPVQYTRRVYAPWFGHGLTRKDLKALDPELYRALSVWVSRHPDDAITELPAQSEIMDDLIDRLSAQLSLDELRKLGYAIDTRLRRASKK
jgi:hypothetical protein